MCMMIERLSEKLEVRLEKMICERMGLLSPQTTSIYTFLQPSRWCDRYFKVDTGSRCGLELPMSSSSIRCHDDVGIAESHLNSTRGPVKLRLFGVEYLPVSKQGCKCPVSQLRWIWA